MSPEEFAQRLRGASRRIESASFREALDELVEPIREEFQDNFQRAEDDAGVSWPARSEGEHPLLRLTFAMFRAVAGDDGTLERVGDRSLELGVDGNKIPYAYKHQKGIGVRRRKYLYLNQSARRRTRAVLIRFARPIVVRALTQN